MAELSKQALKVENNSSFPNNNTGYITPAILRDFNTDMIDSMVDEQTYNVDSASWNNSIEDLNNFTSSLQTAFVSTASFNAFTASTNAYTASNNTKWNNVEVATSSLFTSVANLNQFTASQLGAFTELNTWSASAKVSISALNQASSSLQSFTQSATVSISNLNTTTASLNTSVSNINQFTASTAISINALNQSSASQQISIDSLNSKTGSYATTGSNIFTGANTFTSISASSFISASEFIGNGSKLTGLTSSISMPILDEGIPQGNAVSLNFTGSAISATVIGGVAIISVNGLDTGSYNQLTQSFNSYTASTNADLAAIHQATASLQSFTASFSTSSLVSTASFNQYTQSNDQRVSSLETNSASVNISITNLNAYTASQSTASIVSSISQLNQATASLQLATASLFTSTSLSLITASFDNGTRNLTFTKGDTQTFTVNIPDVSGSAGNFATTGSNQFNGDQSISGSVTLSGSLNNVNYVDFNTASVVPAWKSGRVYWDNTDGCLAVYNAEADITLQVGQEMWVRARNNTGVTIANGAAVRLIGALGDNPLIVLAQAVQVSGSAITDNQILGIATHAIETGTDGYVTTLGNVRGLNTNGFTAGDVLFVSSSAGLLTNVVPVAPYERIPVATVVKVGPGTSGILYVAPIPPIDFSTLSSVEIAGNYTNDDVWIYEGNVWKHKSKLDIGLTTTSSFNAYTSSNDAKVNSLIAATGSYATTGSNTFVGNQIINADLTVSGATNVGFLNVADEGGINFAGTGSIISSYGIVTNPSNGDLVFNTNPNNGRLMTFSSTTGRMTQFNGLYFNAGNGNSTNGGVSISTYSGSMFLTPSGFTSDTASMLHISASDNANLVNLVFKNNDNTIDTIVSGSNNIFANQTVVATGFKRYIGGNGNIYLGTAPQISGSMQFSPEMNHNYSLNGLFTMRGPVTSSNGYTIQSNIIAGTVNLGSSATLHAQGLDTLSMGSNYIGGIINVIANQSNLTGTNLLSNNMIAGGTTTLNLSSSAIQYNNNISNAQSVTLTNQYYSSSLGLGSSAANRNNFAGGVQTIIFSGSKIAGTTNVPQIQENFIGGGLNIVYSQIGIGRVVGANEYHDASRNMVFGTGLYITGSSLATDTTSLGSAFFGRWNSQDGSKARTAETIFAVGTGTATGIRKTGFLIDSGSNTFIEGTLNISGATSLNGNLNITGSLTASLQEGYVWVGNGGGLTTTVATSSFGGGGAAFPYTGDAQITGSLGVTGSMSGFVNTLNISSNTASLDFNNGNFFTLQLVSGSITHLTATNIRPGQTINLLVKTDSGSSAATGSLTFSPTFKFAGGFDYTPTAITASQDLVSFVTFDTTQILAAQVKNLS